MPAPVVMDDAQMAKALDTVQMQVEAFVESILFFQ